MIVLRPIDVWHGPVRTHRAFSPFNAGWSDTADLLLREARAISPHGLDRTPDVIVQLDVSPAQIRIDGQLRAGTRVDSPRVVVSLTSKHGPLRYECDRFQTSRSGTSWQANVRAIALGLEALRKVERYGIAGSGEQYRGWTAIASGPVDDEIRTLDDAVRFIVKHSDAPIIDGSSTMRDHYRSAARRLHPDTGGTTDLFQRLQAAWRLIPEEQR